MDESQRRRLEALDEALAAVPLPSGLPERIAASVEARSSRRGLGMVLVLATAAVLLAFVIGRGSVTPRSEPAVAVAEATPETIAPPMPSPQPVAAVTRRWDDRLEVEDGCTITGATTLAVDDGCRLRLREPELELEVWRAAELEPAPQGVRLRSGTALFHVASIAPGAPRVRVEVAAGAIEVIGTRFAVTESTQGGHVDLLEGAIAFVDHAGTTHAIAAGQRLAWEGTQVVAAAIAPTTVAAAPRRAGSRSPALALDEALERVAALRRSGRYRDAIEVLVAVRRSVDDDATAAAVLSYEEGTLRARVDRPDAVCAYWRGHLARFGAGDHAASITEQMDAAGCGAP